MFVRRPKQTGRMQGTRNNPFTSFRAQGYEIVYTHPSYWSL